MIQKRQFSKEYTDVIKGAAILMMLAHHLFFGQLEAPIHWFGGDDMRKIFATLFKVCVSMFAILSGYGLAEQYKKKKADENAFVFSAKKTVKMMTSFWLMFVIFVPLGFVLGESPIEVYGTGTEGIKNLVLDGLGVGAALGYKSMNFSWWYMEAAIFYYLLFPVFHFLIKRLPLISLLAAFILFWQNAQTGCREIYWLFPFMTGTFCSKHGLFDKYVFYVKHGKLRGILYAEALAGLVFWTFVRSKAGIGVDVFFGLGIMRFIICFFMNIGFLRIILGNLGICSGYMYMIHSFIYYYYHEVESRFYKIPSWDMRYIVLVASSFLISFGLLRLRIFMDKLPLFKALKKG